MELDLATAGGSDALDDTVSYAEIAGEVVARITGPSFDLIERLAEVVADDVLRHRLVLSYDALSDGVRPDEVLERVLDTVDGKPSAGSLRAVA